MSFAPKSEKNREIRKKAQNGAKGPAPNKANGKKRRAERWREVLATARLWRQKEAQGSGLWSRTEHACETELKKTFAMVERLAPASVQQMAQWGGMGGLRAGAGFFRALAQAEALRREAGLAPRSGDWPSGAMSSMESPKPQGAAGERGDGGMALRSAARL